MTHAAFWLLAWVVADASCSFHGRTVPVGAPLDRSSERLCAGFPWRLGMIPAANHIYASRVVRRRAATGTIHRS